MSDFLSVMESHGLIPPNDIEPGRFCRFPGEGKKKGNTAGWCMLFPDSQGGVFGDFSRDLSKTWQANSGREKPPVERAAFRRQVAEVKKQVEFEQQAKQEEASKKATEILKVATGDLTSHPYAIRKQVPIGKLVKRGRWPQRGWDDALLIPIYDSNGKIVTVQAINEDGTKDLLSGGKKKGCFYPLGKIREAITILIGEGLATVAAGSEVTGLPGVVAIDAGNLLEVGKVIRKLSPRAEIIFLVDDDKDSEKNFGIVAATKAAKVVNGKLAFPGMDKKADFWDLWNEQGADAVVKVIKVAKGDLGDLGKSVTITLLSATDIEMQPIQWIWPGWLAGNKLHIIAGAPGTGKSTIAISLAATITGSGIWPDGTWCQSPGNVLIWSGEDDPADTLLPRLVAAGADLERIKFISAVNDGEGIRSFDPARDMIGLEQKAKEWGDIRLLICDPVVSAIRGDSHKNAEVRRGLQPLVDFGKELGAAVLGISHFTKGTAGREPLERVCGSLAFGALARVVWGAIKAQNDPERRILARMKSNIGPDGGGFVYSLQIKDLDNGAVGSLIQWGEALEGEARTLMGEAEQVEDQKNTGSALSDAMDFLSYLLKDGPLSAKQVKQESSEAGFSWPTIRRAKDKLEIKPQKKGMNEGWSWEIPPKMLKKAEDTQQILMGNFEKSEHLRENECEVF